MDHISKEMRSWNMSRIRSKNTSPEKGVRSLLHRLGYRFRLHRKDLPGKPDIVLPKYKIVIDVRGCFWHRHPGCNRATIPKTNTDYWARKFENNVKRDRENKKKLKSLGWKIIIIWECQLKKPDVLVKKLENTLNLDYPREKLEITVVSDGSTDCTVELVRPYLAKGVLLFDYPENRGKMSVINRTIPELSGELVVFTDASAIFRNDALRFLISGFSSETVGAVSGALILKEEKEAKGELSVDLYWRLEKFVREQESRLYSCVSATGAIYGLRRRLFSALPEEIGRASCRERV